jgi:hypothetical protein
VLRKKTVGVYGFNYFWPVFLYLGGRRKKDPREAAGFFSLEFATSWNLRFPC